MFNLIKTVFILHEKSLYQKFDIDYKYEDCLDMTLRERGDYGFDLLSEVVCLVHGGRFGVYAYDWLGVGLAEVYPAVGEVYLHAVDVGHCLVGIALFHSREYGIYIDIGGKFVLFFAIAYSG